MFILLVEDSEVIGRLRNTDNFIIILSRSDFAERVFHFKGGCDMRKPHRKQRLAWLLTAALLLTHLPVSILSEEIIEHPIQTEIVEQNESGTVEEPNLSDFPTEETGEPIEPPVSQKTNETPESGEQSETVEIPADENTPDIPDQDKSETPEPSDSDIEETPSPEVP